MPRHARRRRFPARPLELPVPDNDGRYIAAFSSLTADAIPAIATINHPTCRNLSRTVIEVIEGDTTPRCISKVMRIVAR